MAEPVYKVEAGPYTDYLAEKRSAGPTGGEPNIGLAGPSVKPYTPHFSIDQELAIIHETKNMTELYLEEAKNQGKQIKDNGLSFQNLAQDMISRKIMIANELKETGKISPESQKEFDKSAEKYTTAITDLSKPEEKQGISLGKITSEGLDAWREVRKAATETVQRVEQDVDNYFSHRG